MSILVPDAARAMGWFWASTRGSGKSTAFGKVVVPGDALRADPVPVLFLDPGGRGIDAFLDHCCRLTRAEQERHRLRERVVYVDLAGSSGHVTPFPFLYRLADESLLTIASRPIETLIKTDRALLNAPILGANALRTTGTAAATILAATGHQLTELEDLLVQPQAWAERIRQARERYPDELDGAAHVFLEEYPKLPPRERQARTGSLRAKLGFLHDPAWRALFGADRPGLDLDEIVVGRKIVLLDFRHVPEHLRKLLVVWVHHWLIEWVRARGPSKEATPLSVIVDEATYLLGSPEDRADPLADDLAELVQRLSRNANVHLLYAVQEIHQLSRQARQLMLDLGIQTYGATADVETAMEISKRFFRWSGTEVRKREEIWHPPTMFADARTDERTHEYSRDEFAYVSAKRFLDLPVFTYYLGVGRREGELPTALRRVTIRDAVERKWVQEELVARARVRLARRSPRIDETLAAIAARQTASAVPPGPPASPAAPPRPRVARFSPG